MGKSQVLRQFRVCFVFLLLSVQSQITLAAEVLVLNSYDPTFAWTNEIVATLEEKFAEQKNIELLIEYMDTKTHTYNEPYISQLSERYKKKFKGKKFDAIIVSDDNALDFVAKNHSIFQQAPVIFVGINNEHIAEQIDRKKFTGVLEISSEEDNLALIFYLHPNTKKVVMIYDYSSTGDFRWNNVSQHFSTYPDAEFIRIQRDQTLGELAEYLSDLDDDTAVLYGTYYIDSTGRYISLKEVIALLTVASRRPIYTTHRQVIPSGTVGGKVLSGRQQAQMGAEITMRILNGVLPDQQPIISGDLTQYVFNHDQLERFNIDKSLLPKNSEILGEPVNLFVKYRNQLLAAMGLLALLIATIILLLLRIKENAAATKRLYIAANFDSLTGLRNRFNLEGWLEKRNMAEGPQSPISLFIFDIDHFKYLNDYFGSSVGDEVLKFVVSRLRSLISDDDEVYRVGSDQFVVVCCNRDGGICTEPLLLNVTDLSIWVNDSEEVHFTLSGGSADSEAMISSTELLQQADIALCWAKRDGGNTIIKYNSKLGAEFKLVAIAKRVMNKIIASGEPLPFHFQPIFCFKLDKTIGFEMLMRIEDENGQSIPPPIAVTACSHAGYNPTLNLLTLDAAFRFMSRHNNDAFVAINFTRTQLLVPSLINDVKNVAAKYQQSISRLVVEVVEDDSMEGPLIDQVLCGLSELGVRISLDDFGSGYSSIINMKKLPISFVKLDKIFLFDERMRASIAVTNDLCKSLKLLVIVEGIETAADLELCKKANCDYGQGYFLGRPADSSAVTGTDAVSITTDKTPSS